MEESRSQFEYEAGKALNLPTSIIELARKGDGYDHAFDSMNIMQPLNGWWVWWKASRAAIEITIPESFKVEMGAYGDADVITVAEMTEAICGAGLKIKGE